MSKILHYKYSPMKDHSTPHVNAVPGFGSIFMAEKKMPTDHQYTNLFGEILYFSDISDLAGQLKKKDVAALHAHYGQLAINLLPYKKKLNLPLITSFRGKDATSFAKNKENRKRLKKLFAKGDLFLPVCKYLGDRLIKLGCPEKKIQVFYGGVDLNLFEYRPRSMPVSGPIRFLSVGRFVEKKGFHYLVKAFAKVHQSYPNTELKIIGRPGSNSKRVEQIIKRNKLQNCVTIHNSMDHHQIVREMHQAHIFCLPSIKAKNGDEEGIPNVLKEAMATGAPVISTKHAGIPELIRNKKEGLLVKERDVQQLAEAMKRLAREPWTWRGYGYQARKRVEEKFNLHRQLSFQAKLYKKVIDRFKNK